jgi:hypothetical protein
MKRELEEPSGSKSGRVRKLSSKQLRFCDLVASGYSQASAWKIAYRHPKVASDEASEQGWRITQSPGVKERIAELRSQAGVKVLLTLNDRLAILAEIAQSKTSKANDKARAIEVYSRIAGDQPPDNHNHTVTGPNGQPIPVVVSGSVLIGRLPVRDRIAMLKERRRAETKV